MAQLGGVSAVISGLAVFAGAWAGVGVAVSVTLTSSCHRKTLTPMAAATAVPPIAATKTRGFIGKVKSLPNRIEFIIALFKAGLFLLFRLDRVMNGGQRT